MAGGDWRQNRIPAQDANDLMEPAHVLLRGGPDVRLLPFCEPVSPSEGTVDKHQSLVPGRQEV